MTQSLLLMSAGVIVYRENSRKGIEYLLLKHTHGDHWDFPKGKIEFAESTKEAALRELQEETGLEAHIIDDFAFSLSYKCVYDNQLLTKTVSLFLGKIVKNSAVMLSHEHSAYAWLTYSDAYKLLTYHQAKEALMAAHRYIGQVP